MVKQTGIIDELKEILCLLVVSCKGTLQDVHPISYHITFLFFFFFNINFL